jgi:hypothetical protein
MPVSERLYERKYTIGNCGSAVRHQQQSQRLHSMRHLLRVMPECLCYGLYPATFVAAASGRRDTGYLDEQIIQSVFYLLLLYAAMPQGAAPDGYHERLETTQRKTVADAGSFGCFVLRKISGKRAPARPGSGDGIHDTLFFSHEKSPVTASVCVAGDQAAIQKQTALSTAIQGQ